MIFGLRPVRFLSLLLVALSVIFAKRPLTLGETDGQRVRGRPGSLSTSPTGRLGTIFRKTFSVLWWTFLVFFLLLIFSLVDTRWNAAYQFNIPPIPLELSRNELEKAHPAILVLLEALEKSTQPLQAQLATALIKEIKDAHSSLPTELIKINLQKVQGEISQKSSHISEQFNNKFILVGAIFGLIVVYFKESLMKGTFDTDLEELCHTNLICSILAISVLICISLDIHERANIGISNAHSEWIARYIEAPILDAGRRASNEQCSDPNKEGPRNGWESSLRIRHDDSPEPLGGKPVDGMHHDQWGHLLFAIQYHYLTIVLYIIYVALLYFAFSKDNKKELYVNKFQCRIALALLVIVQMSIFAFAIITRESSEITEIKVIPGLKCLSDILQCLFSWGDVEWLSGIEALEMAGVIGLLPSFLLSCLICRLIQGGFFLKKS